MHGRCPRQSLLGVWAGQGGHGAKEGAEGEPASRAALGRRMGSDARLLLTCSLPSTSAFSQEGG